MSEKLILIDGNSIMNRAFYGLPLLTNSDGLHTNAIYGFVNILLRILNEENGDYLCVAFDVKAPTFRHKMYEAYKGTRKGMPDELREQVPVLKELLAAMNVKMIEMPGYEADDILGTLAKRAEKMQMDVTLVSGDRDLLQVATDKILIRIPKTKGGKTEIENYHTKDVIDKYGLEPLQIIELKALMGDSADNIPGVPKIGEKTATELLKEYHDIENLHDNIDKITKNSVKTTLTENFDMAVMSKKLATIDIDAPVELDFADAKIPNMFNDNSYSLVKKLGFKNLLSKFETSEAKPSLATLPDAVRVDDFSAAELLFDSLKNFNRVGFVAVTDKADDGNAKHFKLLGICLCTAEQKLSYIPVGGFITADYLKDRFEKAVLSAPKTVFATCDLKQQLFVFDGLCDTKIISGHIYDLCIGAYLINPLKNDYSIDDVATIYGDTLMPSYTEKFGKKSIAEVYADDENGFFEYYSAFAFSCYKAMDNLRSKITELGMCDLYEKIEMPLVASLADMESCGIRIIASELVEYGNKLKEELREIEANIYKEAGEEFNINSPVQLGEILFTKMQLPGGKKTKKGYSTAADVLEKLAPDYPFVRDILKYRAVSKLISTYAEGLLAYVDDDGRIRSTFNQTITATGRISSTEPNLQNIPVRMEQGRLIRKVFVPKDGCVFVDADYSQIELRIMASLSKDERLIEAFNRGDDIHAITASKVFKVELDEVTPLMRRNAKAVNFGIIYGISAFGLSEDISVSKKEAKEFIEQYFETFPAVKVFLDELVENARNNGYVTTFMGRRRPVPELKSSNFIQRSFGERVAMNAPIQGSAADIMKIAMIRVHDVLKERGLKSRIILQVHDELLVETYKEELDEVRTILDEEMEGAADLAVRLIAESSVGNNWYEAK